MSASTALKIFGLLVPIVAILLAFPQTYDWSFSWLRDQLGDSVEDFALKDYVLSRDPLVVYVKNFITAEEAAHLVSLADGQFSASPLFGNDGKVHVDKSYRSSMTARLDRNDQVSKQVEERARSLPFYKNVGDFKPFVVQNYGIAGQYRDHYDWFDDTQAIGGNIASTFFVYIHANCTGGGTNFPRLFLPDDDKWCEFVDCDRPLDEGVTFKPILGNAVYWENLRPDDVGHPLTLHAGMPVTSGNKMGMNMWTWKTV